MIGILGGLRRGTFERDEALGLSLLSALAGESMFLLGLPGVGKSMIARRLKCAFENATVFEYLMSRFSTPDEIFGPVSISKLKDEDCYERVTTGYLPEAEVVFLDEIWKAGPAIQNSLLTVLNEKIYLNGNREMKLPLKGVIAASNELPAKDEGLEALWDRFMIRYVVNPIVSRDNFFKLITSNSIQSNSGIIEREPFEYDVEKNTRNSGVGRTNNRGIAEKNQLNSVVAITAEEYGGTHMESRKMRITAEEYKRIRVESGKVGVPNMILDTLYRIRERMNEKMSEKDIVTGEVSETNRQYYVSDRRWKKAVGVMRTSAYINGRREIDFSDVLLLCHILWNEEEGIPVVRQIVAETVVAVLFREALEQYKSYKRHTSTQKVSSTRLYSPDGKHYVIQVEGSPMKIAIGDYEKVMKSPADIFFGSETADGRVILRQQGQYVLRWAKKGYISINNFVYPLRTVSDEQLNPSFLHDLGDSMGEIANKLYASINSNIFLTSSDLPRFIQAVVGLYKGRFDSME